jgi:hypothetical protein
MQAISKLKYATIFSLILISLLAISNLAYFWLVEVSAQPSSFPRQEINVGSRNGIQVNLTTNPQSEAADYKGKLDNSSDIQRVTYYSDGKTLNTTLWLGAILNQTIFMKEARYVVYGIFIDVDNNPATGKFGVDYQKEIQWNSTRKTWNSFLAEYSSPNHFRTLESQENDTIVFEKNQKYFLLPLNLESITFPSKYRVLYYAVVTYNNSSKTIIDLTGWIDIPPAVYTLSTLPTPLVIRQGEKMDIGVQLKSNSDIPPKAVSFVPSENYSNIKITFNPQESTNESSSSVSSSSSSASGTAPAPFRIEVPNEAPIGQYTIPILANIYTGSLFPSDFINLFNSNLSVPTQGYFTQQANLTLSVIKPPSISEQVKDFWSVYGAPISLLGAGFAGALSTYIFDYLKNRKKAGAPISDKKA